MCVEPVAHPGSSEEAHTHTDTQRVGRLEMLTVVVMGVVTEEGMKRAFGKSRRPPVMAHLEKSVSVDAFLLPAVMSCWH